MVPLVVLVDTWTCCSSFSSCFGFFDMLLLEVICCHCAIGAREDPKRAPVKREARWFLQLLTMSFTILEAEEEEKGEQELWRKTE